MASPQTASADAGALAGEYAALTGGCGVLDRSERGKLALTGPGAVEFLNGQVTNELTTLGPGRAATRRSSRTRARCSAT